MSDDPPPDLGEMIAGVMNTDSLFIIRQALESHVYWQLSEPKYRRDGYVIAPGADDEELAAQIRDVCELDESIASVVEYDTDLPALLQGFRDAENAEPPTYRCACSWVGGDPDILSERGRKLRVGPCCPACWKHDKKRVPVTIATQRELSR